MQVVNALNVQSLARDKETAAAEMIYGGAGGENVGSMARG
jgi:hypothetical protein